MFRIMTMIVVLLIFGGGCLAQTTPPLYITESDGAPGGAVTRLIVTNGTLTISGRTATLTISGGGGGISGSGTAGQMTYWSGASAVTGSPRLTFTDNAGGSQLEIDNKLRLLLHGGDPNADYSQLSISSLGLTTLTETVGGTKNFYVAKIRTTGNPSTASGNLAFFSTAGGTAVGEINQTNAVTLANASPQFIINPSGSNTNTALWLQSYGSPTYHYLWRANGTSSSPTAVLSGQTIGGIQWDGQRSDSSVSSNYPARLYAVAKENWTGTDHQATAVRIANSLPGVVSFPEKDAFEFYRSSTTMTTQTFFGNAQNAGIRFNGAQLEWSNDSSTWNAFSAGGGTPGGSDGEPQFNNAGAFAGMSGLQWSSSLRYLADDQNLNSAVGLSVTNAHAGNAAASELSVGASGYSLLLSQQGAGFTTAGAKKQSGAYLAADSTAGLTIAASDAAGVIEFYTGGTASANRRISLGASGVITFNGTGAPGQSGVQFANLTSASGSGSSTAYLAVDASGNVVRAASVGLANSTYWLPAAACVNTTASSNWDLFTSNTPTPACVTGSNQTKGIFQFPDSDGDFEAQQQIKLTSTFTGTINAVIKWNAAATSGDVVWQLQCACAADGETDDPAWNTAATVTDTAKGTTLQLNDASITGVPATGCAAGELLHLRIVRNRTHASDTITGVINLIGVELVLQ